MVLKFDEYIKEGLWSKGVDRSKTGDKRLENGHKYKTSLGVDIEVNCSNDDVENIITTILNSKPKDDGLFYTDGIGEMKIGYDEYHNIISIYFPDYSDMEHKCESISKEDYSIIIESIGTAIKKNVTEHVKLFIDHSNNGNAILLDKQMLDEIGDEDKDWPLFKNTLDDWVNQNDKYNTSTIVSNRWTIRLNYDTVKDFPKIYENVQECLKKWKNRK